MSTLHASMSRFLEEITTSRKVLQVTQLLCLHFQKYGPKRTPIAVNQAAAQGKAKRRPSSELPAVSSVLHPAAIRKLCLSTMTNH